MGQIMPMSRLAAIEARVFAAFAHEACAATTSIDDPAGLNWGVPEWSPAAIDPPPGELDAEGWMWEFLRRSPGYRLDYVREAWKNPLLDKRRYFRWMYGLSRPLDPRLGADAAGPGALRSFMAAAWHNGRQDRERAAGAWRRHALSRCRNTDFAETLAAETSSYMSPMMVPKKRSKPSGAICRRPR